MLLKYIVHVYKPGMVATSEVSLSGMQAVKTLTPAEEIRCVFDDI